MQASQKGCSCGCGCSPILIIIVIAIAVSAMGMFVFFRDMSSEKTTELNSEYNEYAESIEKDNVESSTSDYKGNETVSDCSQALKNFVTALHTNDKELFEKSISLSLKSSYKKYYSSVENTMNDKKNTYRQFCGEGISIIITGGKVAPWSSDEISMLKYLYESEFGDNIELDGVNFTCNIVIYNGTEYISEKAMVSMVSENGVWKINSL